MTEAIKIKGINHVTFAVADLKKAITFYKIVFGECLVAESERLAYFDVGGLWFALNVEAEIKAEDRQRTYSHVAFSMNEEDQRRLKNKLEGHGISYESGRPRNSREGASLYIRDADGHLIEFHSKTLADRLKYYAEAREDVKVHI